MKRRTMLAAVLAGAAGLAGCKPEETQAPRMSATEFFSLVLADTAGVPQPVSQWQGRPLLVNFWATWCAPCVKEMPDLDRLSSQFPQIAFLGIGIDSSQNIEQFLQKIPVSYPQLEARGSGLDIMRALGNTTGGLPFTVIMDADGKVRRTVAGQIDPDDMAVFLRSIAPA